MFLLHDFYPLWAGGRAVLEGRDPYDNQEIIRQLLSAGVQMDAVPGGFHNPPWALWLFAPLGALPLTTAKVVWLGLLLAASVLAMRMAFQAARDLLGVDELLPPPKAALAILCFFPLLKLLLMGQSTFVPWIGVLGAWWFLRRGREAWAGAAAGLTLIKPQLFLPWYVCLAPGVVRGGRVHFAAAAIAVFAVQCGLGWLLRPQAFTEYAAYLPAFQAEREGGLQVTIGHVLGALTGLPHLPLIAAVLGILAGLALGLRAIDLLDHFWSAVLLGAVLAPYAWSHDDVIVFVPYLLAAAALWRRAPRAFALILVLAGLGSWMWVSGDLRHREIFLIWLPAALLVAWPVLPRFRRGPTARPTLL